jgi:DNA-binding SARP family transcriptional activator
VLAIRLLGEPDLALDGERLPPLESARAQSLLAYLVLHDDAPQSRQRLAFMLWPDSTESQARTNLRHLLHTLRTTAPAVDRYLDVTPRTLRWRRELPCDLDVRAFEEALARAAQPETALRALREAVDLYAGDLLEGCYDEWIFEERERLRDRYRSALQRLTELLADRGEHGEAIRAGRALLRFDPLPEDSYRLLMRTYDAAGDRAAAVRVYHECVSTLQRELGVEPSGATKAAYAALMHQGAVTETGQAPARVSGALLVGRAAEWDLLTACWRDAERGHPHLVLVTGEPGVGKTRLVEELAAWCAHRGAVVGQARSYASEGELGYGVAISWLRSTDLGTHLRRASTAHAAELARLLPELDGGASAATSVALDAAEQRRRTFEALGRVLVAPGRPTLLAADDAQWCDEQSLQLIHYLVRLDPGAPLLVVGTVRREDLDRGHPLTSVVAGLQAIDRAREIPLGRLDRAETTELARHLARRELDPALLDSLYAETEGNPLFVVETLRAGWDAAGAGRTGISPKLHAVINARFRQLSEPARALLGVAATVGREFTAPVLANASSLDDDTLVPALDELWRRGIIREQGTDAYDFAHGRIRDVAYDALSPATRRQAHLLVARALLAVHERDPDPVSGEVARHFDRSGQVEDAVSWYRRAAVQAQRLNANVEAVRLLDRAQDLVATLPDGAARRTSELAVLSALPTPLAVVEGFASARLVETQRRVLDLAGAAGVDPEPSLLRSVAVTRLCHHDFTGARAVAARLQQVAEQHGDAILLVESEYLLGIAAFWGGAFDEARQHFERAVRTFDPNRMDEHLMRFGQDSPTVCHSRLANTLWFLGRTDDARRVREEAVARAVEVGHPFSRGVVYVFASLLAVDLDEPDRYREYVAALCEDATHQALQVAADTFLGYVDVLDGRHAAGIRRIREAMQARPADDAPGQRAVHVRLLVAAHEVAGDAAAGLAASEEALRIGGTHIWEAELRRLRASFLAALGAPAAEVDSELARATAVARSQGAVGLLRRLPGGGTSVERPA